MLLPLRLRAAATYSAGAMYLGAGCLLGRGVKVHLLGPYCQ